MPALTEQEGTPIPVSTHHIGSTEQEGTPIPICAHHHVSNEQEVLSPFVLTIIFY